MDNDIARMIRSIPAVRKAHARLALNITNCATVMFDYDTPKGMADYDDAKAWCEAQFAGRFTWRADVEKKTAIFGFTCFPDALHFALWAPAARLH